MVLIEIIAFSSGTWEFRWFRKYFLCLKIILISESLLEKY